MPSLALTFVRLTLPSLVVNLVIGETLKVRGIIQSAGAGARAKAALEIWRDAINNKEIVGIDWKVDLAWIENPDDGNYTAAVRNITNSTECAANCADVIFCPYTSALSRKMISAVPLASTVPIFVWGAAEDSIFSTSCANLNCFGTLTLASQYTAASLDAIKANSSVSGMSVATISNSNALSQAVISGTKSWLAANNIMLSKDVLLSANGQALSATDIAKVDEAVRAQPDVIVIAGNSGDVEEIIMRIRSDSCVSTCTKAVIATNAFTSTSLYLKNKQMHQLLGVIMPDQWAKSITLTDSITQFTTQSFQEAMRLKGQMPSYHAASAMAGAIAITHAMQAGAPNARVYKLLANLKALAPIDTFYGTFNFGVNGSISGKPMYGRQWLSAEPLVTAVIPPDNLVYPMPAANSSMIHRGAGNFVQQGLAHGLSIRAVFAFVVCRAFQIVWDRLPGET